MRPILLHLLLSWDGSGEVECGACSIRSSILSLASDFICFILSIWAVLVDIETHSLRFKIMLSNDCPRSFKQQYDEIHAIHDVGAHLNSREHDVSQSFFQLSLVDSDIIS